MFKDTFDAQGSGGATVSKFDMNKLMKQAQEMQSQMAQMQEEAANEIVEASAGGGMVTVKATVRRRDRLDRDRPEGDRSGRPRDAGRPRPRGRERGAPLGRSLMESKLQGMIPAASAASGSLL